MQIFLFHRKVQEGISVHHIPYPRKYERLTHTLPPHVRGGKEKKAKHAGIAEVGSVSAAYTQVMSPERDSLRSHFAQVVPA